jgi:hypothetical protein
MTQALLDFDPPVGPRFCGETYEPALDQARLGHQLSRVVEFMSDHLPHTLADIARATGAPEASVSARLRDMRRPIHRKGLGYRVDRTRLDRGLHSYRWVQE